MSIVYETLVSHRVGDRPRTLRLVVGRTAKVTAVLPPGRSVLGRSADAGVLVQDATVSRRHAEIVIDEDGMRLVDLGSVNGTSIGGRPLAPNAPTPLAFDQLFAIGAVTGVVFDGPTGIQARRETGGDELQAYVEHAIAEHAGGESFAVCALRARGEIASSLDAIAALTPPRGIVVTLSERLAFVVLPHTRREVAAAWFDGVARHFSQHGVDMIGDLTVFPDDGDTVDDLCPRLASYADSPQLGTGRMQVQATDPRAASTTLSPAMRAVDELIEQVASTPASILILGETGVGKEVTARRIHARSLRARGPFVALNCAALPETLLESELFGYEKGAFTGANASKEGLIESAGSGTLFLDELGEMPLATQAKLLRVLEERAVLRVGSVKPRPVDIRLIAATNRDLQEEIAAKRFRADLYYRLNSIVVRLPPLRERREEIAPLVARFAEELARTFGRKTPTFGREVMARLEAYSWPGNVRELRNAVERAVLLAPAGVVSVAHLPDEVRGADSPPPAARATLIPELERTRTSAPPPSSPPSAPSSLDEEMARLERAKIVEALEKCAGNQTRAAEMLGITRRALVVRIAKYNVPRPRR